MLSRSIYHDQPFLLNPSGSAKPRFGDKGLIRVVLALLHRSPSSSEVSLMSPWKSVQELILTTASSATLVCCLVKWFFVKAECALDSCWAVGMVYGASRTMFGRYFSSVWRVEGACE